jgi:galactosylgalactosylxylosylprotein 3-beta-glucuronosyltransferase 3
MRHTKAVSIWPVGFVGGLRWEGPVCKNNTIVDFRVAFEPNRTIPVDMAGFAVNAKLIVDHHNVKFNTNSVNIGHESDFLAMITSRDAIEPLGDLCNKVKNFVIDLKARIIVEPGPTSGRSSAPGIV